MATSSIINPIATGSSTNSVVGDNSSGSVTPPIPPLVSVPAYVRPKEWLELPTVIDTDEKFVGLISVGEGGTFSAFSANGNYTVDWGDGTVENINSGVQANHFFDYNNSALANTNIPILLIDTGDLIEYPNHPYIDGNIINLYNIANTIWANTSTTCYVINSTTNNFQISENTDGSPIPIINNGTATLLPYKQSIVTITPQAGQQLTILDLNIKNSTLGLSKYETRWLDISISGSNLINFNINALGNNVYNNWLEKVDIINCGNILDMNNMFAYCYGLQTVSLPNTNSVTNMSNMFAGCFSLRSVSLPNTNFVIDMSYMFSSCSTLQTVSLPNTNSVTNMSYMFADCYKLNSVSLPNTNSVTNMNNMFAYCYGLQTVSLPNTNSVTNMNTMFNRCFGLQSISIPNINSVTSINNIFYNCNSLNRIKNFPIGISFSVENCQLSATALNEIYTNLPVVSAKTITVTGNYGITGSNPTIATNKGWTVIE